MIEGKLAEEVQALTRERQAFVVATVVRARRPTSVRPGDSAVVRGDGTIDGFVGGVCAQASVRLHALRAIETGEPLLLRLVPGSSDGDDGAPDAVEGAVVEHNPCLSGGTLEIFLEPHLPAAQVLVFGASPIAVALRTLADAAGYDCGAQAEAGVGGGGAAAVVVCTHGSDEETVLAEALVAGVPYVALVASPRRGEAVKAALEVPDELRAQLHTPAGLDIGARTPTEIAISILAEMVAAHHADPAPGRPRAVPNEVVAPGSPAVATDPVCGMQVAVVPSTPRLDGDGQTVYFCSGHCRSAYAVEHATG